MNSIRSVIAAAFSVFLAIGCQSAMNSSSAAPVKAPNVFPLTFKKHGFEAHCYNVTGCKVIYDNHDFSPYAGNQDPAMLVSPAPRSPEYKKNWGQASYIGIRNFPPPAEVTWTSLDGTRHEAKVDIGAIFKDELVLHKVPESDYAEQSFGGSVDIFLEVNDRTISVYMMAFVATKTQQIPGNRYSNARTDLIQAWSRTY